MLLFHRLLVCNVCAKPSMFNANHCFLNSNGMVVFVPMLAYKTSDSKSISAIKATTVLTLIDLSKISPSSILAASTQSLSALVNVLVHHTYAFNYWRYPCSQHRSINLEPHSPLTSSTRFNYLPFKKKFLLMTSIIPCITSPIIQGHSA